MSINNEEQKKYIAQFLKQDGTYEESSFKKNTPDLIEWGQTDTGKALTRFAIAFSKTRLAYFMETKQNSKGNGVLEFSTRDANHIAICQIILINSFQQLIEPLDRQTKFGMPQNAVWAQLQNSISESTFKKIIREGVFYSYFGRRVNPGDKRNVVLIPNAELMLSSLSCAYGLSNLLETFGVVEAHAGAYPNDYSTDAVMELYRKYVDEGEFTDFNNSIELDNLSDS